MPRYPEEIVRQLKAHADIAAVIQRFIPLRRRGSSWIGLCPFHDDHTPSFHVTPSMGIYKCFACGAGGDVFRFVMEHERLDFTAAVELVAAESGFTLPAPQAENQQISEERSVALALHELADEWFQAQLKNAPIAQAYLAQRGIHEETRRRFHIGWAPEGRDRFLAYAASKGFSPSQVLAAGLAQARDGGGLIDKFRGRLMFAIQNLSGKTVAFGGRIIQDIPNAPKYLNSSETPLYSKGQILYGLHHAKDAITRDGEAILVEGYFDLISLHQSGITHVIAASGTALTEHHARILARYAKRIYLVFDGDNAGRKAARRSLEILLPVGLEIRALILPADSDPDEWIREQGPDAFRHLLHTQSRDFLDFLEREHPRRTPEERAAFLHEIRRLLHLIRDPILRQEYLDLAARRYAVSRQALQSGTVSRPSTQNKASATSATHSTASAPPLLETRFLLLMWKNPQLWHILHPWFDAELFESRLIAEILDQGLAFLEEQGSFDAARLMEQFSEAEKEAILKLPEESWSPENALKEFLACMIQLQIQRMLRVRKILQQIIAQTDQDRRELEQHRMKVAQLIATLDNARRRSLTQTQIPEALNSWQAMQDKLHVFLPQIRQILNKFFQDKG